MAIINSIEDIQEYTDVRNQLHLDSLLPLLPTVLEQYVYRYVPQSLYGSINDLVVDGGTPTELSTAVKMLRAAVAPLLMATYIPRSEAYIGSNGLQRNEGENDKSAYKYQSVALARSYMNAGMSALGNFVSFVSDHASDFPDWTSSVQAQSFESILIKSGNEFNTLYPIINPSLSFIDLSVYIMEHQEITMPRLFGSTFETIPADVDDKLMYYWKKILAYSTIQTAIGNAALRITENGLTTVTADTGYGDNGDKEASTDKISIKLQSIQVALSAWIEKAITFLNENASLTKYPDWYEKMQAGKSKNDKRIQGDYPGIFTL